MKRLLSPLFAAAFFLGSFLPRSAVGEVTSSPAASPLSRGEHFQPFTGRVVKNKVRLRLQGTYDGPVWGELNRDDLVVVLGESDDFYAVRPPEGASGYIFRTYVLDKVVEGNHVNVRLRPELDAPVLTQLNSGDSIEGAVAPDHSKWLKIALPENVRFYVAKNYVEKAGDAGFKDRLEGKRRQGDQLLHAAEAMGHAEMEKPVDQIHLEGLKSRYEQLFLDYSEFPELMQRAKASWAAFQESYTAKKLTYLENQSRLSASAAQLNKKLAAELQAQKGRVNYLEQQIEKARQSVVFDGAGSAPAAPNSAPLPLNMSAWLPVEDKLFHQWAQQRGEHNPQEFYDEQRREGFALRGIIEPYLRPIKSKPGDYMLVSSASKLPVAFLYSTQVNLNDYVGREVTIVVSPRPNHHFAFPAYFVLGLE